MGANSCCDYSDQLCSIVYSLSGTYFVGCFYTRFLAKFALLSGPSVSTFASYPDDATMPSQSELVARSAYQSLKLLAYDPRAQEAWTTCGTAENWEWYYILAVLPFAVRFVQSLRRYRDSNLHTHLINVGNVCRHCSSRVHGFVEIGWKVWDGDNPLFLLLLLEARRYARVDDDQHEPNIVSQRHPMWVQAISFGYSRGPSMRHMDVLG